MKYNLIFKIITVIVLLCFIYCSPNDDTDNNPNNNNISGIIDNTFGVNGLTSTEFGNGVVYARDAVLQNDGKIIIVGFFNNGNGVVGLGHAIARFNSDGSLDNSFSSDGKVTYTPNSIQNPYLMYPFAVGLLSDNKILVAGEGYSNGGNQHQISVVKHNNDGSLDNNFGTNGVLVDQVGIKSTARAIYVFNDGKFIICGISLQNSLQTMVLVKYNSDGTRDVTFGNNGISLQILDDTFFSTNTNDLSASLIYNSFTNKLIVATNTNVTGPASRKKLFSFNMNGTLDSNFGNSGVVNLPEDLRTRDFICPLIVAQNDKYIVGGGKLTQVNGGNFSIFYAVGLNNNGTINNSFSNNGLFNFNFGSTTSDFIESLAIQSTGKIIAAGWTFDQTINRYDIAICRLNVDGSVDASFGIEGKIIIDQRHGNIPKLLIDSNDRIVIVYTGASTSNNSFNMIRLK